MRLLRQAAIHQHDTPAAHRRWRPAAHLPARVEMLTACVAASARHPQERGSVERQRRCACSRGRVDEVDALCNLLLEVRHHLVEPLLLVGRECSEAEHLLHTLRAELARGRKVGGGGEGGLDVRALNHLLALHRLDEALCEEEAGIGHGERGGARPRLGLDDLVAAKLNAVGERGGHVSRKRRCPRHLRQQRQDGDARVPADDWHVDVLWTLAELLGQEGVCAAHVQSGDAHDLVLVVDAGLLEHLGRDRHRRVDRVRDDRQHGVGAELGAALHQRLDD
mmetsp:Transcript_29639/g.95755  ORF Transcript_29639/g.95755 Transcript_29639/m.95755 type:complete len:279 (+) Transcript_29639:172-1008(+)